MKMEELDPAYSLLLGRPWLRDAKVTHDWGNNMITIHGNGKQVTISVTKSLGAETKRPDVLVCYDLKRGITDEEEEILLLAHLNLVTIAIISMADFSKKDTIGCYGTTEKEDNIKTVYPPDFYQHEVGNVIIDDTPTRVKVQKMKIAGWTLPEEEQVRLLNLGTEDAPQCIKVNSTLPIPIATKANALFT